MSSAPIQQYLDAEYAARFSDRELNIEEILELLPHRPPFLLLDRILSVEPCQRAVGIKAVTINEPFFVGHFPGHPVMPGVLIIEALAQVGGVVMLTGKPRGDRVAYFTGIKEAKFREPVRPGDLLRLEAEAVKSSIRFGRLVSWMAMKAFVDDKLVAEANCSFVLVDPE